jgi:hypothetical protein
MQKQSEKTAALYYCAANKRTDSKHLDNQMNLLLCYAKRVIAAFDRKGGNRI